MCVQIIDTETEKQLTFDVLHINGILGMVKQNGVRHIKTCSSQEYSIILFPLFNPKLILTEVININLNVHRICRTHKYEILKREKQIEKLVFFRVLFSSIFPTPWSIELFFPFFTSCAPTSLRN